MRSSSTNLVCLYSVLNRHLWSSASQLLRPCPSRLLSKHNGNIHGSACHAAHSNRLTKLGIRRSAQCNTIQTTTGEKKGSVTSVPSCHYPVISTPCVGTLDAACCRWSDSRRSVQMQYSVILMPYTDTPGSISTQRQP